MPPTRDMNLVERAFMMAYDAHFKQRSRRGRPYILHPIRVMEQMDTDEECAVALLHDVLEDSDIPVEALRKWFPEAVVEAVELLTFDNVYHVLSEEADEERGEKQITKRLAYQAYIRDLAENPLARKVKIADLKDNLRVERLPEFTRGDSKRMHRYFEALTTLLKAERS